MYYLRFSQCRRAINVVGLEHRLDSCMTSAITKPAVSGLRSAGIHDDWVYKGLEAAKEGIIGFFPRIIRGTP
jgi:hypothetical protein